jgi:hypothetical protein
MQVPAPARLEYIPPLSPPWEISTGVAPTPMTALGGGFAIQTYLKGDYLTAVNGGGKTTDVIHTNAIQPRGWERFRLWADNATHQYYALQTLDGHFISANNAGGLTSNTVFSTATVAAGWEMFTLLPQAPFPTYAIQTLRGFFLTAVGGGGHGSGETIHTDAVKVDDWERFNLLRTSDFGSGSTYGIQAWGGNLINPYLTASSGGRLSGDNALTSAGGPPFWVSWTLLKQDDGSYAFQTASGGILTANGGGLVGEGFRTDTELDMIGNWEKFTIVDNGDFTAYIKTHAGTYLTATVDRRATTVIHIDEATRWRFWVFSL